MTDDPPAVPPEWILQQRLIIGKRIRMIRRRRALSQERLGQLAGLGRHTIYLTELGQTSISLDRLLWIAHGLGVPIARLFTDE